MKSGSDGEKGFSGSSLPVAGNQSGLGIQKCVNEALLPEVQGAQRGTSLNPNLVGDVELVIEPVATHASRHSALFPRFEENVFIGRDLVSRRKLDGARAGETLKIIGLQVDDLRSVSTVPLASHFVCLIVFAGNSDGVCFELEIEIFRHEDGWSRVLRGDLAGAGQNAIVIGVLPSERFRQCRRLGVFPIPTWNEPD